ncbi:MAG: restriction endonuclease subunit S [Polyangiales bacterium]
MAFRLGDICSIQAPLVDPTDVRFGGLLHVGAAQIEAHTGRLLPCNSASEDGQTSPKFLFTAEDVLYSKIRPYLRKVALPESGGLCSADVYPLRPHRDLVLREYLAMMLLSDEAARHAKAGSARSGIPKVNRDHLFSWSVSIPPVESQRKVVSRIRETMERVEEIESLQQERLRDSERLLRASLTEVFREITSEHPPRTLGSVFKDCRYGTSTKCRTEPDHVAVLRIPNVSTGVLSLDDLKYCAPDAVDEASLLSQGDLLIIRTNGSPSLVGRTVVYQPDPSKISPKTKVSFASYLIRLRFDESRCIPEFVRYYLASSAGRQAINRIRRSSAGQSNINSANIKLISLPMPGVDEQRKIVERLTEIERASRALAIEADHNVDTKIIRAAILRQAFSGKL